MVFQYGKKMIHEQEKIEDMLNRFFEGQTSGEEEQTLYRFFRQDGLPAHLARYKPVFRYFETGLAEELPAASVAPPRILPPRRAVLTVLAAAILAGCIFCLPCRKTEPFDPYEGSYIIRNGVRITDPELIRPELEKSFREALRQQADTERLLNGQTDPDEILEQYRQFFEQQRNALLNGFTDPSAREEARKILATAYINF
jgi:hypothetical protein